MKYTKHSEVESNGGTLWFVLNSKGQTVCTGYSEGVVDRFIDQANQPAP